MNVTMVAEDTDVWLSAPLVERLQLVEGNQAGVLYGLVSCNTTRVLGCYLGQSYQSHQSIFPAGFSPIGVFTSGEEAPAEFIEGNVYTDLIRGAELHDECLVIWKKGSDLVVCFGNEDSSIDHKVASVEECYKGLHAVLLSGHVTVRSWMKPDSIEGAFKKLMNRIMSDDCTFLEKNSAEDEAPYLPLDKWKFKKGQVHGRHPTTKEVQLFLCSSGSVDNCRSFCIRQEKEEGVMCDIPVKLQRLAIIAEDFEDHEVHITTYLKDGIWLQLDAAKEVVLKYLEDKKNKDVPTPVPHLFYSEHLGHFVNLVYPEECNDDELLQVRKRTHEGLLLPKDKPFFRRANAIALDDKSSIYLENPHLGLNLKPLGGQVSLVSGIYAYHHYMQDNMDDDGWGCAYRSFQTIFSWFRYQGYTVKPVPTHKEIQKCLVDLKDKPENFIGSRQWIGSTELSYCLQDMLDVTSKIIYVSSGKDLSEKARQFVHHFRTQGTPIMIGGGVLAHTILGVDFNEDTGDVKWLILDPHYKGAENLKVIQNKGWVGWKSGDFWDANSYYNACLPQRPEVI